MLVSLGFLSAPTWRYSMKERGFRVCNGIYTLFSASEIPGKPYSKLQTKKAFNAFVICARMDFCAVGNSLALFLIPPEKVFSVYYSVNAFAV